MTLFSWYEKANNKSDNQLLANRQQNMQNNNMWPIAKVRTNCNATLVTVKTNKVSKHHQLIIIK